MEIKIQSTETIIRVSTAFYTWEWDHETDILSLFDHAMRLIGRGCHQPLLLTTANTGDWTAPHRTFQIDGNRVLITYAGMPDASHLTVSWSFHPDFIALAPLRFESPHADSLIRIVYFPGAGGDSYKPSFYSRYAVVPGLSMSTTVSPVVDLHSRLNVTSVLGSGAMRGPGLTQQWGLPAHYFCTFNTAERWNAIGAGDLQSGAVCWGLAELPAGDFRLEIREIGLSPVLNLRSDLWGQVQPPDAEVGASFLITFGENFHEAIRNYYRILLREAVIQPKRGSARKNRILLAPQYNTWGVESALALRPEELTEGLVRDILAALRRSGMKARTFVIDDKWEGRYGELRHDPVRFPRFASLLDEIRQAGYHVGLWAAFLRCQDPSALGLNESHLLQLPGGNPLWLSHGASRYGIFDVTQPVVQDALQDRARQFIRTYRPDLIKFDFGYELPSLDVAAPANMAWAGERLLQKGLDVIVGAMKEENPDLVVMYYGLSPLLIEHYDLHSPDDLVYCGGEYDLETNRRLFFSSLCGELGMPTYGSSGYDWESAPDIWFDSAVSGTLGSLHCFDGDENGALPKEEWIAKYNGLSAILRQSPEFQVTPLDAHWQGGLRAAFAPSWRRTENNKTVLLALRTHRFDGKPARRKYDPTLDTDVMMVVASMTDDDIAHTRRMGIVPFGDGRCTIRRGSHHRTAHLLEHYLGGGTHETRLAFDADRIELNLSQARYTETLEWLEIIFQEE